ncbi:5-formyltetrahydrofolate cyclo-ligase [Ramaria rubella]|nr:5-formyltetrahydrofolate cyclo-ligase [Ramaria rubella]
MNGTSVSSAKKALRSSLRQILKLLSPTEIEFQSGLTITHIISHPAFKRARTVSCYLSMPSGELNTNRLIRSILEEGKILFTPRIDHSRNEIDMLRIYDEEDLMCLQHGTWGIREPGLERGGQRRTNVMDADSPILDIVILPGLAFDSSMSRLGHGKGYYDRFLTSYQLYLTQRFAPDAQSVQMPTLMGLSLTQQLRDSSNPIPMTDHDWKIDLVVHPRGLVKKRLLAN